MADSELLPSADRASSNTRLPRPRAGALAAAVALALLAGCGADVPPPGSDGSAPNADKPDPPKVARPSKPTRQNPFELTGRGQAGLTIEVRGRAKGVKRTEVTPTGRFGVAVPLRADRENTLVVLQRTASGVESDPVSVTVIHDGTPPAKPRLGPLPTRTNDPKLTVSGTAEASAVVAIAGADKPATGKADAKGAFSIGVVLRSSVTSKVENDLSVTARDAAGNVSTAAKATVTYDPDEALAAPKIAAIDSPTNASSVAVKGTTQANATVTVTGGRNGVITKADAKGSFSLTVKLRPNVTNKLFVVALITGKTSPPTVVEVIHDDIAPGTPSIDPVASPTSVSTITLRGRSEPSAKLAVSGGAASASTTVKSDGSFSVDVKLKSDAKNQLSVAATDAAGNKGNAATLSVVHDSSLPTPIKLDSVKSPTNQSPITLTGTTQPNVDVSITGGATSVQTKTDSSGKLSASVTLKTNATNELHVKRVGSKAETIVTVVHDGVAPTTPRLNALASPTGDSSVTVSGTAEPKAAITVSGGAATASSSVASTGVFSVSVTLNKDAINYLSVVAADAAGNRSKAATASVTHSSTTPPAPTLDDPSPSPTSKVGYTVSGRVEKPTSGMTAQVSGASASASGTVDASTGRFAVAVTLKKNTVNKLSVTAKQGAIVSPAALVSITHDDTAPSAPSAAKISIGSGSLLCALRSSVNVSGTAGAVEASGRVQLTNKSYASKATVTANSQGGFTATLTACKGDKVGVKVTDAAGNTSSETVKTVP